MILALLRGTIAGYAGTAVMDASQTSVIPAISSWIMSRSNEDDTAESDDPPSSDSAESGEQQQQHPEPPLSSPEKVAQWGAGLIGVELDREQIAVWGNRVHWVYGTQWGIAYTLVREKPGPFSGLAYGAGLWALSDELLLWALRIAKAPSAYPLSSHLQALAAHCVYGSVVGTVAKGLRR